METRIKATDIEMNRRIEDYLDERLQAIEKHLGADAEVARCEIELGRAAGHSRHGENWFAEFQIRIPGGNYARVAMHAESVTAAIDGAKDELLRKLRTTKRERAGFLRKSGAKLKEWMRWGNKS